MQLTMELKHVTQKINAVHTSFPSCALTWKATGIHIIRLQMCKQHCCHTV